MREQPVLTKECSQNFVWKYNSAQYVVSGALKGLEDCHCTLCFCSLQTWQEAVVYVNTEESKRADEYSSKFYLLPVSYGNHSFARNETFGKKCRERPAALLVYIGGASSIS